MFLKLTFCVLITLPLESRGFAAMGIGGKPPTCFTSKKKNLLGVTFYSTEVNS